MRDPHILAEQATVTSVLNSVLRETGSGEWLEAGRHPLDVDLPVVRLGLPSLGLALYAAAEYRSATGKHRFALPVYIEPSGGEPAPSDYVTFVSLLLGELAASERGSRTEELLSRILQSNRMLAAIIRSRLAEAGELYDPEMSWTAAEQALVYGHAFHPTPKSRQGFPEWREPIYSPETRGSFRLHYYAIHRSIVQEQSILPASASEIIREELFAGFNDDDDAGSGVESGVGSGLAAILRHPDYVLVPLHPVQAAWVRQTPDAARWRREGSAIDLGEMGAVYAATSSIRTVVRPGSRYMYKLSLQAKITNSMRLNKRKELTAAIEAGRLMLRLEGALRAAYPAFRIMPDAASLAVGDAEAGESGFELLIRPNPFGGRRGERVYVVAALTQDPLPGHRSLLANVIGGMTEEPGADAKQRSLRWFRKYLDICAEPLIGMYLRYGIALEAHQQNCLVRLDERGYPSMLYYRDGQGYYYARSAAPGLESILPGISSSTNFFDDRTVEERFGYYLVVNHLWGIVQAFGSAGLIDERVLLAELYGKLESLHRQSGGAPGFIPMLLTSPSYRCKANLLTRLADIDELDSELEQAVYVNIANPLRTELPSPEAWKRAVAATASWRRERETLAAAAGRP